MSSNCVKRTQHITCIFVIKYKVEFYAVNTQKFRKIEVIEEDFMERGGA